MKDIFVLLAIFAGPFLGAFAGSALFWAVLIHNRVKAAEKNEPDEDSAVAYEEEAQETNDPPKDEAIEPCIPDGPRIVKV